MNLMLGVFRVPKKQKRIDVLRGGRAALRYATRSSCNLIYRTQKGSLT